MKLVLTSLAVGLGIVACSGSSTNGSTGGASAAAFVGTWSCTLDSDGGVVGSADFTIAENPDGSLTSSKDGDGGALGSCTSNQLSVSGSTASVPPNYTCSDGLFSITVQSLTFTLNGSTLALYEDVTLSTDAGSANLIFAGTCAKK